MVLHTHPNMTLVVLRGYISLVCFDFIPWIGMPQIMLGINIDGGASKSMNLYIYTFLKMVYML